MWQFVTDHDGDIVWLTLRKDEDLLIWRVHMDRALATRVADAISKGNITPIWIPCAQDGRHYNLSVVGSEMGGCIIMIDDGNYMVHKVVLTRGQRQDLASTLQIHIRASELDTRPKDVLPPLDESNPGQWSLENERSEYGLNNPDENDPADFWKKG